jgi:Protein of unknown function (DUF2846)
MRMTRRLLLVLTLTLAGCVAQNPLLPTYAAAERDLPSPGPGTARLYFYRLLDPNDPQLGTTVMLNDKPVGFSRTGTVLYRDVPPGSYFVSVRSPGQYPFQFKTVQVQADQTWYFRIESLSSWAGCSSALGDCRGDTFVVAIVAPQQARIEIAPLGLVNG